VDHGLCIRIGGPLRMQHTIDDRRDGYRMNQMKTDTTHAECEQAYGDHEAVYAHDAAEEVAQGQINWREKQGFHRVTHVRLPVD
jgi:hypothetical protein